MGERWYNVLLKVVLWLENPSIKMEPNPMLDVHIKGFYDGGATWQNQILLLKRQGKLSSDFVG